MMTIHETSLVPLLKKHFRPAMDMLQEIIVRCPGSLLTDKVPQRSVGKRLVHALESLDYFLNDFGTYHFPSAGKPLSAEYDDISGDAGINRNDLQRYFHDVKNKLDRTFSLLSDGDLLKHSAQLPYYTNFELFLVQLRHISLNTGRCHEVLYTSAGIQFTWTECTEQP